MASAQFDYGEGPQRFHVHVIDEATPREMARALIRVQVMSPELRLARVTLVLTPVIAWYAAGWPPAIALALALVALRPLMMRGLVRKLTLQLPVGGELITEFTDRSVTLRTPTQIREFRLISLDPIKPVGDWVVFSPEGTRDYYAVPEELFPPVEIVRAREAREASIF
ncbi:MAG: hypothetical protein U0R78_12430 [Nocardioidaceae bacterium]